MNAAPDWIGVVITLLMLAALFGLRRVTPWQPMRWILYTLMVLLLAVTVWNIIAV